MKRKSKRAGSAGSIIMMMVVSRQGSEFLAAVSSVSRWVNTFNCVSTKIYSIQFKRF